MSSKGKIGAKSAEAVLRQHFKTKPRQIKELGGGLANHVFEAQVDGQRLVVRMSEDPARLPIFMKEQWAIKKAREHGVPVAEILEVGNEVDGLPYMILEKVEGQIATDYPDPCRIVRELGAYARRINSIPTRDFGNIFDWSRNRLSRQKTWAEFMDHGFHVEKRLEFFAKKRLLDPPRMRALRREVERLRASKQKPSLTHGDLRLKNVLLDGAGKIRAIIDWEHCSSNLAPYWELSIALHDLSIDEKEAFLEGYGITAAEYQEVAPAVKALNILNYFVLAHDEAAPGPGPEWLRARLNGALDLYSL